MSLTPANQPACSSDWLNQEEGVGCQGVAGAEHAPLSPQSSVASSGSEQTEEQSNTRNTFQEDGSGMKGDHTELTSPQILFQDMRHFNLI